jgi:hypothetical protein
MIDTASKSVFFLAFPASYSTQCNIGGFSSAIGRKRLSADLPITD